MDWKTDFAELRDGVEALVFFSVGGQETIALVRRKGRVFTSTWDGAEAPSDWTPIMFCIPTAPDPALIEDDY